MNNLRFFFKKKKQNIFEIRDDSGLELFITVIIIEWLIH